jgi:hypothetical protein
MSAETLACQRAKITSHPQEKQNKVAYTINLAESHLWQCILKPCYKRITFPEVFESRDISTRLLCFYYFGARTNPRFHHYFISRYRVFKLLSICST